MNAMTHQQFSRRFGRLFLLMIATCFAAANMNGIAALAAGPVKVFVLAGQSNMVGHGKVEMGRDPTVREGKAPEVKGGLGCLRQLARDDPGKYGYLLDKDGDWIVRDDVWLWSTTDNGEKGPLTVGSGKGRWIGPEFGFGHTVGKQLREPVLIIKTAWGGKDLAVDFRPPSAGMPPCELGGNRQKALEADPKIVGHYYRLMLAHVREVTGDLGAEFPELAGRKTEIAGFGWHQGWNDGCNKQFTAEYEKNLAHLIRDLRMEFKNEKLPVVIASSGFGGEKQSGVRLELSQAQMAVADAAKYPEFKGNVFTVDTRPFHRTAEQSPSNFGYHWNHNGETHYLMGEAMGVAMLELLKK
jgi:alpha-galactosidase